MPGIRRAINMSRVVLVRTCEIVKWAGTERDVAHLCATFIEQRLKGGVSHACRSARTALPARDAAVQNEMTR